MEIFNNTTKVIKDDLKNKIQSGSHISIAAACFSIYAYQELKAQLEACNEFRFIFTSPTFVAEKTPKERREFYIPRLKREKSLYGTEFEVRLRNELKQKAVAKECAEWMRRKAHFKSNTTREGMNHFLVVEDEKDSYVYSPVNTFTTVDLGCERGNNLTNMITRMENPASTEFLHMFESVWNDADKLSDVTEEVIDMISTVYQENSPELIYFMTLYNIFNEFLEDISEDILPNEATGFKDSIIWNKLFHFQKDAALAIINKLEQYNGCILADSVGLGKTFTALAVIKYYEGRNKNVLVLCPKKLSENWMTLIKKAIAHIDDKMFVSKLQYTVTSGEQGDDWNIDQLKSEGGFLAEKTHTYTLERPAGSLVKYDLVGKVAEGAKLTRRSAARILSGIRPYTFSMFKNNPEEFITKSIRLINEQKATMIVEQITYNQTDGSYDANIFTAEKNTDFSRAYRAKKNIQDYVFTDGYARDGQSIERRFAQDMDLAEEVCVYAKLPKGFSIPTPVGNYSPDWAIAFYKGTVKYIYFIAETKGTMETLNLKPIEKAKIDCAKKLFQKLSGNDVVYDSVDSYQHLLDIMGSL